MNFFCNLLAPKTTMDHFLRSSILTIKNFLLTLINYILSVIIRIICIFYYLLKHGLTVTLFTFFHMSLTQSDYLRSMPSRWQLGHFNATTLFTCDRELLIAHLFFLCTLFLSTPTIEVGISSFSLHTPHTT